ncbi:MAG: cytochrome c oxidase assembly protein [Mesorhizobium sp.]|nr:cytochrome c oxidase assembly protein [Mesorhizobium sp.]
MNPQSYDPYCGPPPVPGGIWTSWNFDPWLLVAVGVTLAFCAAVSTRGVLAREGRLTSSLALFVLFIAFVSPLCALSTALFSARVLHHVLLVAAAAPLLALAFPARPFLRQVPLTALFLAHTLAMWVWHAPSPYAFALYSHAAYWLMEGTLFVTALLMWQSILARWSHPGAVSIALLGSVVQMGMLGALITFAARPMYEPHLTTTLPFGLTPLADQQLAGLLMWVPASLPYIAAALVVLSRFLSVSHAGSRGVAR